MTVLTRLFTKAPETNTAPNDRKSEPAVEATGAPDRPMSVDLLFSPSALSVDASSLMQAIANIDDPAVLKKLTIEGPSTTVRQLAAHAMHDPVQLRDLLKHVRGKDKNVYKIIREKCDALLAVDKAAADTQEAIAHLCAALEKQVHVPFDNLYEPALEHFINHWGDVAAYASPEMHERADKAIDRCREILDNKLRAKDEETARTAAIAGADVERSDVITELRACLEGMQAQTSADDERIILQKAAERWSELARVKPANREDQASYAQLRKSIEELSAIIAQHGSLAQFEAAEQARKEKQEAEATALRQLGGLIRKASGALHGGNTRLAAGLRRAVEDKLQSVPDVPAHLTKQLQQLDEKLNVLQDWRSYAVAPKRIELIEHMEALVGMDESPQALADQIKKLQEEWKTISKGNTDDTDAEWQRFHQAAQKAYEPCAKYFSAQAKQREGNLAKRKAILERLTKFVAAQDWQTTDWKEIARALRESKQLWRNHQFVERGANKPLQKRFDELTKDLESRLEAESATNAEEKKRIIERAKALLTNEDSRQAIDAIKQLQAKWTSVGIVAREDDQKLWAEFRQHCDAVFAKRQQQRTELASSLSEAKAKAVALCEEAEGIAALTGAELIEGAKKLSALTELFEAVGELPKADARGLHGRFERAVGKCEKAIAAQRTREKAQAWFTVLEAGDKIRLHRLAASQGGDHEAAKQNAIAFIDGVTQWPKGALQIIKAELLKSGSSDLAANENALRTLCIRSEILTDTPTPDADQAFRRNYQLQRLMKGMGQTSPSKQDELNEMVFEWIAVGATSDAVYRDLLDRFTRCRG